MYVDSGPSCRTAYREHTQLGSGRHQTAPAGGGAEDDEESQEAKRTEDRVCHGKGDGKLREEVQKMLKKEFNCDPYDARYAEYGMQGTTEVVVR